MEKRPLDIWCVGLNSTGHMCMRTVEFTFEIFNGKQLRFFLFPFVKPCAIINKEHIFYSDWERRTCFVFDCMPVAKASVQRRIPRSTGIMPYSEKPDQPGHLPGTAALL